MLPPPALPPTGPQPAATPGPHDALPALRARAEKRRHLATQAAEHHTPEELQRLVQELQVHQLELEMQYEELLLAQADAQAARAQYVDLYDFAPVSYFSLSPTGQLEQLNLSAAQLLGTQRQRLVGRRFAQFVVPAQRLAFGQFLARVLLAEGPQHLELTMQREDGSTFSGRLEGLRVLLPAGPQCRLAVLDTTASRRATEALAASEARFRRLFADSADAVVLLQGHCYVDCNAAALRLLGLAQREQLVGRPAWVHAPATQPDGQRTIDLFRDTVAQAVQHGSCRCEALMHRATGEEMWVEAVLTPIEMGSAPPLVHILWRDMTAAHTAAEALRHEKEFSESLLENAVDGLIALDHEQRITAWNAEAARIFGLPAEQALGQPLLAVLPLHTEAPGALARALQGERTTQRSQVFGARPGHFDVFLIPLPAAGQVLPTGVLMIVRDVTERDTLAEATTRQRLRQQQEVLAAILSTQETERKRIAEALHNGLGQLLYAAKLSLEPPGAPAHRPDTLKLLDEAVRTTRTISFELTPGILEDFGLRTALEELVKRLAPAQLPVRLHLTNLEERAAPQVEITVYRVVQELLNNVMKHAGATEVEVHVAREDGRLEVSVEDNGQGFEPALLATEPLAGIGLAGVRNRVALLGGELHIASRLGRGTIVSFELALE